MVAKSLLGIPFKGRGEDPSTAFVRAGSITGEAPCAGTLLTESAAERRAESRALLRVVRTNRLGGAPRLSTSRDETVSAAMTHARDSCSRETTGWALAGGDCGACPGQPPANFRRAFSADDVAKPATGRPADAGGSGEECVAALEGDSGGGGGEGDGDGSGCRPRVLVPSQQAATAVIASVAAAGSPGKARGPAAAAGSPKGGGAAGRGTGGNVDGAGDGAGRKRRAMDRLREDPAPRTNALGQVTEEAKKRGRREEKTEGRRDEMGVSDVGR